MKQEVCFPDRTLASFDVNEEWLVKEIDLEEKKVVYEGRGKNEELEFSCSYLYSPHLLDGISEGELVHLPKELFLSDGAEIETFDQLEWF
ncbi:MULTISPECIES: hypothetical protein [unclassified Streptococcus]|uniref:hypothetical protein n=1 Tax=unclassified Streptococcus TaxID=2608887 RepID=UPI00211AC3E1|nr:MULTISPECIES: hypothetical protein [unclassified Streptococcus]MCQ9212393.1 hypothetical protein [Streptococcus sp. B01]MCQ9213733.1 hypothetical protein [Streptococcus sp. O1]MCQ9214508.1 hypothetical protein [Streptococcus sp. O1]